MTQTLHSVSVLPLTQSLTQLVHVMKKAKSHAAEHNIEDASLTNFRLFPDMLPFRSQVYIATDMAKFCVGRLSGAKVPTLEDTQVTFDDLIKRTEGVLDILKGADVEAINAADDKPIEIKLRSGILQFKGAEYVRNFVLPNMYFHVTTAYAILRHNGVPLGKRDFLGG